MSAHSLTQPLQARAVAFMSRTCLSYLARQLLLSGRPWRQGKDRGPVGGRDSLEKATYVDESVQLRLAVPHLLEHLLDQLEVALLGLHQLALRSLHALPSLGLRRLLALGRLRHEAQHVDPVLPLLGVLG